ncbi:MAG: DUF2254 domain-containing protein [Candidatus Limnocylindria bacterium]
MSLQRLLDTARQSLWFIPTLWAIGGTVAAFGLVAIDTATPDFAAQYPLVFGGGPEGARGLLSSIAGSMITVAGVIFSITIVALQLASSQYSPRVLRNFMRDRPSQIVLGSYIGTFVYSLLVLRTIRSAQGGGTSFVPAIAVTGAIVLALVALGMLVYYIHHIATRMQASHITEDVARETIEEIEREAPDAAPDAAPDGSMGAPEEEPRTVLVARRSGYLQYVEIDELKRLAERYRIVIVVRSAPGDWVQQYTPLFSIWGGEPSGELDDQLQGHITVGAERVLHQDPGFGVQQLVDIGVKALSPGINDPTTVVNVIHHLTEVLVSAGRTRLPAADHADDEGNLRLVLPRTDFEELVATAFVEMIHFGASIPSITGALTTAFDSIEKAVPAHHRAPIERMRAMLRSSAAESVRTA